MLRGILLLFVGVFAFGVTHWAARQSTPKIKSSRGVTASISLQTSRESDSVSQMVWIAGGEFLMGTDDSESWPDEHPAHLVRVDGFWMDETEVTNRV